jgi:hypothetical protein
MLEPEILETQTGKGGSENADINAGGGSSKVAGDDPARNQTSQGGGIPEKIPPTPLTAEQEFEREFDNFQSLVAEINPDLADAMDHPEKLEAFRISTMSEVEVAAEVRANKAIEKYTLENGKAPDVAKLQNIRRMATLRAELDAKFPDIMSQIPIGGMATVGGKLLGKGIETALKMTQGTKALAIGELKYASKIAVTKDGTRVIVKQLVGIEGFERHHILSWTNRQIADHKLVKAAGVDLEKGMWNQILLPASKEAGKMSTVTRTIHKGRHVNQYSKGLAEKMQIIYEQGQKTGWSQQQYRNGLEKIVAAERNNLKSGTTNLNKNTRASWGLPLGGK